MARTSSRYTTSVSRLRARVFSWSLLLAILFVAFLLYVQESQRETIAEAPGELRVWFFDIGQGDAMFIETPSGEQILVDGGPNTAVLAKLGAVMLPWDRTIDAVVATHPDADHIGGLPSVLERYDVAAIFEDGDTKGTETAEVFSMARDREPGAEKFVVRAGESFSFGDVTLTALWPTAEAISREDTNEGSIVFLLTYGDTSVLLMGDATEAVEDALLPTLGDVDVLKAGHHGSLTSTSLSFLADITPEYAIISAGEDNRYGHPHPTVLARLQERSIVIFRTDLDGDILLTSQGGEPEIWPSPLPF